MSPKVAFEMAVADLLEGLGMTTTSRLFSKRDILFPPAYGTFVRICLGEDIVADTSL